MSLTPEEEQAFRDVAAFSEATYNRLASQHELYRKAMDVAKLWVAIQDGHISAPKPKNQTSQSSQSPVVDVADQIRKLADLKAEGLLTEEEFTAQKRKLLSL